MLLVDANELNQEVATEFSNARPGLLLIGF